MAATADPTKKLIQDLSVGLLQKLSAGVVKPVDEPPMDGKEKKEKEANQKPLKKKDVIAGIIKEIERVGVKRMADAINVTTAQDICDTLKVDFDHKEYKSGQANKGRKNVISTRLARHVAENGLEEVLTLLKDKQQEAVVEALGLPEASGTGTSRAIATRISAEVRRIGAEVVLSKMDTTFLKDLGEEQSLELHDISSQATIIKAILTGKVPSKRSRPEKKAEPISKKKPKLEAGISIADMMQHYNLSELQEYARDNTDDKVKISGKKKDLMKRLYDYFEGNEPEVKKAKKEVKKEKETKKEKTPAKKADKKAEKPAKEAEKEEEEEEEEAEAEKETTPKEKSPKKSAKKETGKAKPKKTEAAEEAEEEEAEKSEEAPKEKEATPKKGKKAETTSKKSKSDKVTGER